MRTAEEILREKYNCAGEWNSRQDLQIELSLNCNLIFVESLINEARRECIDECAEAARAEIFVGDEGTSGVYVDKQSILKLKEQIK